MAHRDKTLLHLLFAGLMLASGAASAFINNGSEHPASCRAILDGWRMYWQQYCTSPGSHGFHVDTGLPCPARPASGNYTIWPWEAYIKTVPEAMQGYERQSNQAFVVECEMGRGPWDDPSGGYFVFHLTNSYWLASTPAGLGSCGGVDGAPQPLDLPPAQWPMTPAMEYSSGGHTLLFKQLSAIQLLLQGELHPDTPLIAGVCNSACDEKRYQVHLIDYLTKGYPLTHWSSHEGQWAIGKWDGIEPGWLPSNFVMKNSGYDASVTGGIVAGFPANKMIVR